MADENPAIDAQGIRTEHGWLILNSKGDPWDGTLYDTEDAARTTAIACSVDGWTVAKGKRVRWLSMRPGNKDSSLEDKLIIEK